jgi:hypothetical protein
MAVFGRMRKDVRPPAMNGIAQRCDGVSRHQQGLSAGLRADVQRKRFNGGNIRTVMFPR